MQVFQLIELLEYMDPNAEVHFSYDYGDYWNTSVAPEVSEVSTALVKYSDYHRMDKVMDEGEMHEDEGDFEGTRHVVILS